MSNEELYRDNTDEELVRAYYDTQDEEIFEELLRRHRKTIYRSMRNWYINNKSYLDKDDLHQEATILLWRLTKYFIEENIQVKFISYLIPSLKYTFIARTRLNKIDQNKQYLYSDREDDEYESKYIQEKASTNPYEDVDKGMFLEETRAELNLLMKEILTKQESKVLKLLYGWNGEILNVGQVADEIGINTQNVNNIKNRAIIKIRNTKWYINNGVSKIEEKETLVKSGYELLILNDLKKKYLMR